MARLTELFAQRSAVAFALIAFFTIELPIAIAGGLFYGMAEMAGHWPVDLVGNVARWAGNLCLAFAHFGTPVSLAVFFLCVALWPSVPRISQRLGFVCAVELGFFLLAMLLVAIFPRVEVTSGGLKDALAGAVDGFLAPPWWPVLLMLAAAGIAFFRVRNLVRA
jgi:hypothetical protein